MSTKIENIKTELFTHKAHYLAMRQAWKDFINDGGAKAYWDDSYYGSGKRKRSNLTGCHHLLYCILTERDVSKAFSAPQVNTDKLGFINALISLNIMCRTAKALHTKDYPSYMKGDTLQKTINRDTETIETFLKPFGGTVTIEMLVKLVDILKDSKLTNINIPTKEAA